MEARSTWDPTQMFWLFFMISAIQLLLSFRWGGGFRAVVRSVNTVRSALRISGSLQPLKSTQRFCGKSSRYRSWDNELVQYGLLDQEFHMGRKFDEVQEEIGKGVASVFGFVGFDSPTAFAPCFFFSSWRNAIPPDDTMTCTSVFRAALVELLRAKNRGGSPSLASTERGTRWTAAQPKFVTEKEETHDNCN